MKKAFALVLALALLLSLGVPALAFTVVASSQALSVNGQIIDCEKYNIDNNNYFKLRDIAYLLNGTGSQFDIGWDAARGVASITTGSPYTSPNGTELVVGEDKSATAKVSTQTIMIDGVVRDDLLVYNIGDNNFFQLREMGDALGFDVGYDETTRTMLVTSRAADASLVFTGKGDKVVTGINLPAGNYYAECMHNGSRNFVSRLYYGEGKYEFQPLANEIGTYAGERDLDQVRGGVTDGILEVQADGDWMITFKPVAGTTTTNITGHGDIVTGLFTAAASRYVATMSHSNGKSNFIAKLARYGGTNMLDFVSLANQIGPYSGQVVVNLNVNEKYYFVIQADGDWSFDLGAGDAVTNYPALTVDIPSENAEKEEPEKSEDPGRSEVSLPIAIESVTIDTSSFYPQLAFQVRNISQKTISAVDIGYTCFDAFGYPATDSSDWSNSIHSTAKDLSFAPGTTKTLTVKLDKNRSTEQIHFTFVRGVTYSDGVTVRTMFAADGRTKLVAEDQVNANAAVGWYVNPADVYAVLYALDGRTKEALKINVAAEEAVGWYTLPHYHVLMADQKVTGEGYNAGVEYLEDQIKKAKAHAEEYCGEYQQKLDQILQNWQQAIGCPVAIIGYKMTTNSIRTPEVNFYLRNLTNKTITRIDLRWTCLDAYGKPTADFSWYNGVYDGYSNDHMAPGELVYWTWTLYSNEETTQITDYYMTGVAFEDGTSWHR